MNHERLEKILGKLESYAIEKNLTGITLYDDGGYVKYSDRVKFPTNPLKNAEIRISQFEKMIIYCKTNEKGMYNFILNNSGNYDIRIRTNEKNIKLISNFKYDKSKGFIKQLQEQNVIFNKVNLIVR